jgi:hypothetical protein
VISAPSFLMSYNELVSDSPESCRVLSIHNMGRGLTSIYGPPNTDHIRTRSY